MSLESLIALIAAHVELDALVIAAIALGYEIGSRKK